MSALTACREPTQAYLELYTDALCTDVVDTSITIATEEDLESALPDTTTLRCSDSDDRIGSLAIVPSNGDGEAFSVRVVTGLGKSAEDCVKDKYLGGCIVARRSLYFIPQKVLYLPIEMNVVCRDIPCGATETCRNGHCVDAAIADVDSCTDKKGCDVEAGGALGTGGSRAASSTGGARANSGGTDAIASGGTSRSSSTYATGNAGTYASGGNTFGGSSASGGSTSSSTIATGGLSGSGGTTQDGTTEAGGNSSSGGGGVTGGVTAMGGMVSSGGTSSSFGGSNVGGASLLSSSPMGGTTSGVATGGTSSIGGSSAVGSGGTAGASGTTTLPAICGDGILNPYAGEFCDTAGSSATCNADCTPQRCGDSRINAAAGELCDGSTGGNLCTPSCTLSICGDGYVDRSNNEQCEVGMSGCTSCQQDVSGLSGNLRILAVRDESLLFNSLGLKLTVSNSGPAVSTNGLTIRFYYTPDSTNTQTIDCTWFDANCNNVNMRIKPLAKTCSDASLYAEIVVTANSTLNPGASFDVRGSITGGLLTYNYSNDYSRPAGILFSSETPTITLYQNGKLVWGTPPCGCGNGALDTGESCDHAGESAACNADCTWARCGDGKVNVIAGENCDSGAPNLVCNPECRTTGLPATAAPALLQWLDASHPASVQLAPRIVAIADRSGQSNHVNQTNVDRRPLWFPKAFGNLPAIFFDGNTYELTATSPVNNLGKGSIFIVHRVEPVGISATLMANGWFGSGGGFVVRTRTQLDGLGFSLGNSSGFATTQWFLGARTGSGPPSARVTYLAWEPPSFFWKSGVDSEVLTADVKYSSTSNPLTLGGVSAVEPFRGWIGEVLVFGRVLTSTESEAILAYLRQKWNVP